VQALEAHFFVHEQFVAVSDGVFELPDLALQNDEVSFSTQRPSESPFVTDLLDPCVGREHFVQLRDSQFAQVLLV